MYLVCMYVGLYLNPRRISVRGLPGCWLELGEHTKKKSASVRNYKKWGWHVTSLSVLDAALALDDADALRLISCVCLTHTHTLMSQEVHLMWLAKEAEKAGILAMAMRLGSEKTSRFPVQPVHLVPPGMRFGLCKCSGSGAVWQPNRYWEFSPGHLVGCEL